MRLLRQTCILLASILLIAGTLPAQTLAHKNWQGNGFSVDPWWKNAVFYQMDPADGWNGIIARLDYCQSLDVDALLLSPIPAAEGSQPPWNPSFGTAEDFDRLQQEASRRKIRLLVDLPLSRSHPADEVLSVARFWLSRGVSGLHLTAGTGDTLDPTERNTRIRRLQHLLASFSGDRLLLADTLPDAAEAAARAHRRTQSAKAIGDGSAQLSIDRTLAKTKVWDASTLPATLFGPQASVPGSILVSDASGLPPSPSRWANARREDNASVAKILGTALFLGVEQPMLDEGQEAGSASADNATAEMDSLLNWYRKLSQLRHKEAALHGGSITRIDTGYPEVLAWVRRGVHPEDQPLLVVCNQSARPLVISVAESLGRLGLSSSVRLHTVASSAEEIDVSGQGLALPSWGVYVAELRQPGLEAAPEPIGRSRSHWR